MKTDIVILTCENYPYGGPGANYLRNLSIGIHLNSKYNVLVWLQSGNSRPDKDFKEGKRESINGVHYRYVGGFSLRPRSVFGRIVNDILGIITPIILLLRGRKNIKALIVYNNSSIRTIIPLLVCNLLNIKTFKILPEWYEKASVVTSWVKYLTWWDFLFGMTKQNLYYDGLIVLTYYLRNYYVSKGYPEEKIIILPNLVNYEDFINIPNRQNVDKTTIGYSGTPVKKDGILDLLKAFGLLCKVHKNIELLIIGDLSPTKTTIPYLKQKAIEYDIPQNQIKFTGLIDFKEVPKMLGSCDILVLARPSGQFAEAGFPTKLGEYLVCKKPVVMTKVGDIPKYFTDKINAVLVEPDDPETICEGFRFLIENPKKAQEIAEEGYNWARLNLDYRLATLRIIDFTE